MTTIERGHRKERTGLVVSNKMDKTIAVQIDRSYAHPLYKKAMRRSKKFYADDPKNECKVGDTVRIRETRPLSKLKRWELIEIVKQAD